MTERLSDERLDELAGRVRHLIHVDCEVSMDLELSVAEAILDELRERRVANDEPLELLEAFEQLKEQVAELRPMVARLEAVEAAALELLEAWDLHDHETQAKAEALQVEARRAAVGKVDPERVRQLRRDFATLQARAATLPDCRTARRALAAAIAAPRNAAYVPLDDLEAIVADLRERRP